MAELCYAIVVWPNNRNRVEHVPGLLWSNPTISLNGTVVPVELYIRPIAGLLESSNPIHDTHHDTELSRDLEYNEWLDLRQDEALNHQDFFSLETIERMRLY